VLEHNGNEQEGTARAKSRHCRRGVHRGQVVLI
jgi:hypothetical protein